MSAIHWRNSSMDEEPEQQEAIVDEEPDIMPTSRKRYTFVKDAELINQILYCKPMNGQPNCSWEEVAAAMNPLFPHSRGAKGLRDRYASLLKNFKKNDAKENGLVERPTRSQSWSRSSRTALICNGSRTPWLSPSCRRIGGPKSDFCRTKIKERKSDKIRSRPSKTRSERNPAVTATERTAMTEALEGMVEVVKDLGPSKGLWRTPFGTRSRNGRLTKNVPWNWRRTNWSLQSSNTKIKWRSDERSWPLKSGRRTWRKNFRRKVCFCWELPVKGSEFSVGPSFSAYIEPFCVFRSSIVAILK